MAVVSTSSPETLDPKSDKPDAPENPNPNPDPSPPAAAAAAAAPSPAPTENPNPDPPQNPNPSPVAPPPPSLPSFSPSFRPLGMPPAPQYSTIPNPNPNPGGVYYQNPSPASGGIQPPGVPVTVSMPPPMRPMYPPMPYSQVPNGYMTGPPGVPPPASSCYGSW